MRNFSALKFYKKIPGKNTPITDLGLNILITRTEIFAFGK